MAFANIDDKGKAPRAGKAHIKCHRCDKMGHYASECPEKAATATPASGDGGGGGATQTGAMMLNAGTADGEFNDVRVHFQFVNNAGSDGIACQIGQDGKLPNTWILLDNQVPVDVSCNGDLLTDVREGAEFMQIHCNAGVATANLIGELAGYGAVWYHPKGIANILSLSRVKEHGYHVTYNSNGGNRFIVNKSDGTSRVFKESGRGLYFLDVMDSTAGDKEGNMVMVNTVADNKASYTNRAYSRAVVARNIQKWIGRPSTQEYIQIVERNLLPNCPVNRDDIMNAEKIFGPDLGTLKGKPVRRGTEHVDIAAVPIPAGLMS